MGGISLLLIERTKGLSTKVHTHTHTHTHTYTHTHTQTHTHTYTHTHTHTQIIKTSYSASAGTSYVTMEDVLVPVEHLIGQVNPLEHHSNTTMTPQ
jgi:carbohydrate-binding DOMON domain-containing protein